MGVIRSVTCLYRKTTLSRYVRTVLQYPFVHKKSENKSDRVRTKDTEHGRSREDAIPPLDREVSRYSHAKLSLPWVEDRDSAADGGHEIL